MWGKCEWRTVESTAVSIGVEVAMSTEKTKMKVFVTLLETSSGFVTVATTETCTFPCNSSWTWAKISQSSEIYLQWDAAAVALVPLVLELNESAAATGAWLVVDMAEAPTAHVMCSPSSAAMDGDWANGGGVAVIEFFFWNLQFHLLWAFSIQAMVCTHGVIASNVWKSSKNYGNCSDEFRISPVLARKMKGRPKGIKKMNPCLIWSFSSLAERMDAVRKRKPIKFTLKSI